jgi:dolichyl-phosphate-mannose--protein O-mannosyl transferase
VPSNLLKKLRNTIVKSKYIIIKHDEVEVPLVFASSLSHEYVAGTSEVKSAGFCKLDANGEWNISGESVSLQLKARPQEADILNAFL